MTATEATAHEARERSRKRALRALALIFTTAAVLALAMGALGVVALQVSVSSKRDLVRVYEELAREVESLQVASERRARKMRSALILATPAEVASHAAAREEFKRRVEGLHDAARSAALVGDLGTISNIDEELTAAEDRLLEALKTTVSPQERIALFAREVQPPREDLDDAVAALVRGAHAQVAEAHLDSDRTDTLALAGLIAALALALAAIAGLGAVLRSTLRRLAQLQRRLDDATVFQQRLMGIVSHDIRSPVTAILLGAHRMAKQPKDAAVFERFRDSIIRNAGRVERIAGLLMDVTRFEAGLDIPVNPTTGDLHRTVDVLVEEARAAHPERPVHYERDGDGWASYDEDRIAQVVNNLLNNAARHSPAGSAVRVRAVGEPDAIELSVHNDGRIDERVVDKVFDPFTKGSSTSDRFSAGLGLYVAKKLVEAHGGSISIGPDGGGTTVRVRLPRNLGDERHEGRPEATMQH